MSGFKVGDYITPRNRYKGKRVYLILEVKEYGYDLEVIEHSIVPIGAKVYRYHSPVYIRHQVDNPNHVTVQASTFKDEDELTQEDKQIIKEYLDDKAA